MNTKPIEDYIILDEHNLAVATAVAEALPHARYRLASRFLHELAARLRKEVPHWSFESQQKFFLDDWAVFYFWKPVWNCQYGVQLYCGNNGKDVKFGVFRDEGKIGKRPFCTEILQAIKQDFPQATKNPYFEAQIMMESPAADWSRPEVLWRLQDDQFLDDVAGQLLLVAKTCEPIVDRLIANHP